MPTTNLIRYKDENQLGSGQSRRMARTAAEARPCLDRQPAVLVCDYKYQIRFYENRKIRYLSTGTNANAGTLRWRIEQRLTVKARPKRRPLRLKPSRKSGSRSPGAQQDT
jgi:hypothetical protein